MNIYYKLNRIHHYLYRTADFFCLLPDGLKEVRGGEEARSEGQGKLLRFPSPAPFASYFKKLCAVSRGPAVTPLMLPYSGDSHDAAVRVVKTDFRGKVVLLIFKHLIGPRLLKHLLLNL